MKERSQVVIIFLCQERLPFAGSSGSGGGGMGFFAGKEGIVLGWGGSGLSDEILSDNEGSTTGKAFCSVSFGPTDGLGGSLGED